jgi:hypothetical protein
MSIFDNDNIRKVERVEKAVAVRIDKDDEQALSLIRGWVGLPIDSEFDEEDFGKWVVKREGSLDVYLIDDETLRAEFRRVLDLEDEEPDPEPGGPAGPAPRSDD